MPSFSLSSVMQTSVMTGLMHLLGQEERDLKGNRVRNESKTAGLKLISGSLSQTISCRPKLMICVVLVLWVLWRDDERKWTLGAAVLSTARSHTHLSISILTGRVLSSFLTSHYQIFSRVYFFGCNAHSDNNRLLPHLSYSHLLSIISGDVMVLLRRYAFSNSLELCWVYRNWC